MPATIDPDIILGFLEEVEGYRAAIRDGLARLRETPADLAALEEPHRAAHTLNGAAAMVGLTAVSHPRASDGRPARPVFRAGPRADGG